MSRSRISLTLLFLAVLVLGLPPMARADFARLTLQSQPGDFIGQGGTFDITYLSGGTDFFSPQIRRFLPGNQPAELLFVLGHVTPSPNTFALLFFGTDQLGIPIQPGTYLNAQRADFASPGHPGLDVSFQNRGCNTLTGSFTVHEVTFTPDPSAPGGLRIATFAASFEQHCEGATPALFGTFEFNTTILSGGVIPEPASLTLFGLGALGLVGYSWRRRKQAT